MEQSADAKPCDVADAWWEVAGAEDSDISLAYRVHAVRFYRTALADGALSDLKKIIAAKRIEEVKAEGLLDELPGAGALYCVIDLSAGPNARKYPVSYLDAEPKGGWTDEYKAIKLVLRRIEPGKFMMGGKYEVTLTKPFYCGVFEVTQKQYELVKGANSASTKDDMRSVRYVSWNAIRGDSATYNWPSSVNVDPSTFMGKIRARTGLNFDLPTEAQWEYACWAGTTNDVNIAKHKPDGIRGYPMVVGSYRPNAWGLYDMHENVWEWCLDWSDREDQVLLMSSGVTDPVGPSSGGWRVVRGGCWDNRVGDCPSFSRIHTVPWYVHSCIGFRLVVVPDLLKERGIKSPTLPNKAAGSK